MKNNLLYISLLAFVVLSVAIFVPKSFIQEKSVINGPAKARVNTPTPNPFQKYPLTLKQIFDSEVETPINQINENAVTLVATGDVMLGRAVNFKTLQNENFNWAFENTAPLLRDADITIVNLEGPLTENCRITTKGMRFCGDTQHIQGLKSAGIDVLNLANNHMGDQGPEGLETTKNLAKEHRIAVSGTESPAFLEVKGKRIAFLGFNQIFPRTPGIAWADIDTINSSIRKTKERADFVVVSFHWGSEYSSKPTDTQVELAHKAVEAGADLVIGHHPHWIQPIEIYQDKLIFYSLGNFVFDQNWSQKTQEGLVVKVTTYKNQVVDVELLPIIIEDLGQPRLATENKRENLLTELKNISYTFKGGQ